MSRLARAYAAAGIVLVAASVATASNERLNALPWAGACLLGAFAIVAAIRAYKPRTRGFWIAIATADALWGLGAVAQLAGASSVSSSLFGDGSLLYQPGYLGLAAASIIVLRTTRGARPAPLDAAIGAFIAAAALWPLTVHLLHVEGTANAIVGSLYPAWDLSLTILLLRIVVSPWFRLRSLQLVTIGMAGLTAADVSYSSLEFTSPLAGRVMSVGYTIVYLLLGAAALHPSMRRLPPRRVFDDARASRRTLPVLAVALAVAPATNWVDELVGGDVHGLVLSSLALAAVVLVIARVATLLRHLNETRRRAEESERLFRMIFDAAGVGISVGANGRIERSNPALQRMLGYTANELANKHYTEIVHPDDVHTRAVPRPGAAYTFERRYVRKDGEPVWAEVTLTAPDDNSFGVAVIEDVTTAKRLEQDLRHAQKMEAIGQLAGGIAHDFNNLMTAVIGYAGLMKRDLAPGDVQGERVDAIAGAAERAAELTRKLLAFSRRQVMRLEPVDLATVVREFDPILRRLLPETVDVEYELEDGAVARVDRAELEQVLLNLALNARDAMNGSGILEVEVVGDEEGVELSVTDNGSGMDEQTRLRIFDPFFTTKPVGEGTGLGLSTVDGIVGQLDGTIEVVSEPGLGSTFTIRLPRVHEQVAAAGPAPSAPAADPVSDGLVLLVEDEDVVRHVTTEMLHLGGYEVVAAANAEAALGLLVEGVRPDVLVSDVVMTGIDGPTFVDRARELIPELPVLFVSGYSADALGGRTSEIVLTKPFTPAELGEAIELVRRAAPIAA